MSSSQVFIQVIVVWKKVLQESWFWVLCRYYHCPTERLWLWFCASACRNSATFPVPQWQSGWALSHRLRRHDGPRWFCIDRKHFGLWRQGPAELTCGGWEGVGAIEAPQIILEQRPTEHWPKPCLFGVYRGLYYPVGCFFMAQLSLFNPLDPTACFFLKFPFPLKLTLTFLLVNTCYYARFNSGLDWSIVDFASVKQHANQRGNGIITYNPLTRPRQSSWNIQDRHVLCDMIVIIFRCIM